MKKTFVTILSLAITLAGSSILAGEKKLCAKDIEGPALGHLSYLTEVPLCPKGIMKMTSEVPFFGYKGRINISSNAAFEITPLTNTYLTVKNVVCTEANPCIVNSSPKWNEVFIMNLNNGKEIGYIIKNISDGYLSGTFSIDQS
jgi:hypothetical protein